MKEPIARGGHGKLTSGPLAFLDLFACVAGGNTNNFTPAKLRRLYPTQAAYVNKYQAAADAAMAAVPQ